MSSISDSSLPPTLILAYGNPLRGDDGVGWQAAILLARELKEQVRVLARHQLTPELAEAMSRVERVIFIDAACGGPTGKVCCRQLECTCDTAQAFTHHVSPADLLAAARELYGHMPLAYLITINGGIFDYREALSLEVETALPEVVSCVLRLVQAERVNA